MLKKDIGYALANYFFATDMSFSFIFSDNICLYLHFDVLPSVHIGIIEKTNVGPLLYTVYIQK